MSTVVPYQRMRLMRELKKNARGTAADKRAIIAAYRECMPKLADRTPESMAHEFGRRCRGVIPTGTTAA